MKTAIIKIILQLLTDEKTRHRILLTVASIVVGFLGMLFLPVVVLHVMSGMDPPEITWDASVIEEHMGTDRQTQLETDSQIIANAWEYLKAYSLDCLLTAIFFCFVGFFNGIGQTRFVMIQGILGAFCVRVPVSYLMSLQRPVSLFHIGLATPASSLLQTALGLLWLLHVKRMWKAAK